MPNKIIHVSQMQTKYISSNKGKLIVLRQGSRWIAMSKKPTLSFELKDGSKLMTWTC